MSMRVIGPKLTDRDYGRRLYVSGKEYQTQMREVTDKAKLDQKPFHLSELKKPYATDSYEEMEYNLSWPGGIKIGFDYPFIIRPENEEEETTSQYSSRLKWITEPPDIVEAGHWYLMEVANASRIKQLRRAGEIIRADIQYLLPQFNIRKASADAKGMEVEQRFATISNSALANFMRLGQRSIRFVYEWAKTGSQRFLYLMSNLWDGREGATVVESAAQAKLIVGDEAAGVYEVRVTDGKTILKHIVSIPTMSCEFPSTIAQDDNVLLEVVGGTAPYTWNASLVGTSFGLSIGESTDEYNILSSTATARGSITVTVQDSDGNSCSGTIKCVVGAETYYELTPDKYPTGCTCVDWHLLYTIPYIPSWANGYAWYKTGAETTAAAYAIANAGPGGTKITSWDTCGQQWSAGNANYAVRVLLTYEGCGSGFNFGDTRWEAW
jgi:hypothetical protein